MPKAKQLGTWVVWRMDHQTLEQLHDFMFLGVCGVERSVERGTYTRIQRLHSALERR
eukprot:CAMPEP_0175834934 /NCGR_PEP_ID=MMETSP0107_2-20121207/16320_1 /TAXON_ID=195067 ORGANISM="Goniomonas pacifica, Strain CCMP1869" /NCGR_SAMPLE_ID=MMETSP0107_2 /ASSEMBLY_ACC=CAM_ASM_000203 /LENGTH=56 /DNA_ID=CAMNT_0017148187 /DNA_START=315 /DNA_END=481 /DNA_ORIENTATION=+